MVSSSLFPFALFPFLASLAAAHPHPNLDMDMDMDMESPLQVVLKPSSENAVINAEITNTGDTDLSLLKYSSIFSSKPVEKLDIYQNGTRIDFTGIHYSYDLENIQPTDYAILKANQTFKTTISLADVYDLSSGGPYKVVARGVFPYISAGIGPSSIRKTASVGFESNALHLSVDGGEAAKVKAQFHALHKRLALTGCSGTRLAVMNQGVKNAVTLANIAAKAATSGSAQKFQEYFRTTDPAVRASVAARYKAIATAASTTNSGVKYYCADVKQHCIPNVLAWALAGPENIIANCDSFYNLPATATRCHGQDHANCILHEMTHVPAIHPPGTRDNAYGYQAVSRLNTAQAVSNADTFALYAQAISINC